MLEKLKEYKELIAIVVFFLGGFFWLQAQFPNKSDLKAELDSLHCLLEKYMKLTQLQIRNQELEKQVGELARIATEVQADDARGGMAPLSPAMRLEFEQRKSDFISRRNDLKANTDEIAKVRDELGRDVCRKVGI